MSPSHPDLFEMRRLESLSNTIFGVAMTLLAYDLPKTGTFASLPNWTDLYRLYAGKLSALVLSFVIAGLFWFSHHRRLARQPEAGRGTVILNLLFLLSIILLPVTNGLYSNYRLSSAVAVLYGIHLTTIAALNALLWWLTRKTVGTKSPARSFRCWCLCLARCSRRSSRNTCSISGAWPSLRSWCAVSLRGGSGRTLLRGVEPGVVP
jgi:uncharacterized membrane protein